MARNWLFYDRACSLSFTRCPSVFYISTPSEIIPEWPERTWLLDDVSLASVPCTWDYRSKVLESLVSRSFLLLVRSTLSLWLSSFLISLWTLLSPMTASPDSVYFFCIFRWFFTLLSSIDSNFSLTLLNSSHLIKFEFKLNKICFYNQINEN